MKLIFDSVAIFEEKTDAMKFAGRYMDDKGMERFAICRVSRRFLAAYCNLPDPTPDRLLQAYLSVRDEVNGMAAQLVRGGEHRPLVDLEHLPA